MKLTAYDYDNQKWIEGESARPILIEQYKQELEILNSDEAESYVKCFQFPVSVETAKSLVMKSIKELEDMK